jgi:hypothetical protein
MTTAKTMNRSRNQLASAYAPESFFTFEGGLGACISRSSAGEHLERSSLVFFGDGGTGIRRNAAPAYAQSVRRPRVVRRHPVRLSAAGAVSDVFV